ncbi:MAG: hypothetical protein JXA99_10085 [Candidatus Lokiarchaeota archaeon]|nr:hypothetical protein [Candidatus Lokiarchaeota archaeon]
MEIINICPKCSCLGVEVDIKVLENIIKQEKKDHILYKCRYLICTSPLCNISYFSDGNFFTTDDLKFPIWFKDKSMNSPICYCSNLTRGEIIEAVKKGKSIVHQSHIF